ncbi:hypothetical protein [Vibrio alginolyticus]|uniref:hypothetical protein n=1 Tax=Vibrio alginolyticus TaxID=663 RepID=UPI003747CE78
MRKGIDWDVTIQLLILDDDQTQETHDQRLRNINHLLKMTKHYAKQFQPSKTTFEYRNLIQCRIKQHILPFLSPS